MLPTPGQRSRATRLVAVVGAALIVLSWTIWYLVSPRSLEINEDVLTVQGRAGSAVYVEVFTVPDDWERTLDISKVSVDTDVEGDLKVTPLICRGHTNGVTSKPENFCDDLVDTNGVDLGAGDAVLLRLEAEDAVEGEIERIRISFREGLRWGTKDAGVAGVAVSIGASES